MAGVVIAINGYVLVDFFISEVHGLVYGGVVCVVAASYTAFLFYLIFRGTLFMSCFGKMRSHGFSYVRT